MSVFLGSFYMGLKLSQLVIKSNTNLNKHKYLSNPQTVPFCYTSIVRLASFTFPSGCLLEKDDLFQSTLRTLPT